MRRIISKETRFDQVGSGLVTEPRWQSSSSLCSAFPTRSGNLTLDNSEDLGLGLEINTAQETDYDADVYWTTLEKNLLYTILYFGFQLLFNCDVLKISLLRWNFPVFS